jgi:Undecaprenyl-phosphate glucose phosphotransferase
VHVVIDALVIALSYAFAWLIRFKTEIFALHEWHLPLKAYMGLLIYIIPGYLILYYAFELYTSKRIKGRRKEAWSVLEANVIGLMAIFFCFYLTKQVDFSRGMMAIFFFINTGAEFVVRNVIRIILRSFRKNGYNIKHIILIGYSRAAEQYIDRIRLNPEWGYEIRGILDDSVPTGTEYRGAKVIGSIWNLEVILPQNRLDEIVITLGISEYENLEKIVAMCEKSGVHTKFVPDYNNIIPTRPYTEDIFGLPVINIRRVPLSNTLNKLVKRAIDIIGSLVAIIIFSIPMIIVAIAVKLTSPGPIIFKQIRVGLGNKPFPMYKFRSMRQQRPSDEEKGWTTKNDMRVTKVGKIIRKTSMDEFPQFFNVLKGDMSLVGPRPERPQFVEQFKEEIPRYMIKHQVRPGITGWAQVSGFRGDTSIKKRIKCDLYYIENWTFGFDVKILFMTIFKGFVNKNAY